MAFGSIPRAEHEGALAALQRTLQAAELRAVSLAGQLERLVAADRRQAEAHAQLVAALEKQIERESIRADRADARYEALVRDYGELKRHEIGALPKGAYEAALTNPRDGLGRKTQLAIDTFAAGDQELERHLVIQGRVHADRLRMEFEHDPDGLDQAVADLILAGDTA